MNRIHFSPAALLGALMPLIFDSALKGAALLAVAALVALAMWRASAAARHLVWIVAVVALLILPVLSFALPQWRVLPKWAAAPVVGPAPAVAKVNQPERTYWPGPSALTPPPALQPPAASTETLPIVAAPAAAALPTAHSSLPTPLARTWRTWLPLA